MALNSRKRRGIDALLRPRTIAVLGASAKRMASGNEAIANLWRDGFPSRNLYVVHPSAPEIHGLPTSASIARLPDQIDLALISLPPAAVLPTLVELEAVGCASAIVPTVGFEPDQLADIARFLETSTIVMHGENCMGVLNVSDRIQPWFYDGLLTNLPPGGISLVTQSGSAAFVALATQHVGFSKVVSTGNELDLGTADYLSWLADDPDTSVVGVVMESIRSIGAFTDAVADLRRAGKPVVVLKVGRTERGRQATIAHTGALLGGDVGYATLFDALDVPVVEDYDQLASALQLLATPGLPRAAGDRIAVVTDSGGEAALAADLAEVTATRVEPFSAATRRLMADMVPGSSFGNPLDAGALPVSDDDYDRLFQLAAQDANIDSVAIVLELHHQLTDHEVKYVGEMITSAVDAARTAGKPVALVSSSSISTHPAFYDHFGPEVPLLRGIDNAYVALRAAARNQRPVERVTIDRPSDLPDADEVAQLRAELHHEQGALPSRRAASLLTRYGITLVASRIVDDVDDALAFANERYPVVVKCASVEVPHRSEIGGVVLGITDDDGLRSAIDSVRAAVSAVATPEAARRIEIQEQVGEAYEAMAGFAVDAVFGSAVVAGSGGVRVELERDTVSWVAPVSAAEIESGLSTTRMAAMLAGFRNLNPTTPVAGLVDVVHRLAWLADDLSGVLVEADLNPVMVEFGTGRVRVVDHLLVATTSQEEIA